MYQDITRLSRVVDLTTKKNTRHIKHFLSLHIFIDEYVDHKTIVLICLKLHVKQGTI